MEIDSPNSTESGVHEVKTVRKSKEFTCEDRVDH